MAGTDQELKLFLGRVSVVVVESNRLESDILVRTLTGFKVARVIPFNSTAEAQTYLIAHQVEILVVGNCPAVEGQPDEYDFIRWVRRVLPGTMREVMVLLLSGHTSQANVLRARDCGANFVVAKPITPSILFDRISWLVRDPRPFVLADNYAGPDRRFQMLGPPPDVDGRRRDDLSLAVGDAMSPNMSQAEIDALLKGSAR